ncbi:MULTISPECIES: phosphate/phosphite/phosphonate ABC transporter substrate-binding protein [unclassified Paenibacillus]|uniref:phosphate/phosphite/phosphonate ABC transporter substrate-binding protein n=1 Tax=unclassified Paenibacillus TaxID=185978 RepID=UPI001AE91EDE|nr:MULTISPECIES: phosphate/phosphite/phosphonate ABC transporter substrate-binding protein [unclassified Paenibacillus]MBP1156859.1 phosphonate transport system substrate-binding protein [Paenibacillus sp. PvP091]MBP1172402.1 phosphonate transport system substrate-binding protein [Paenibacillus sp. PvR098]MBP2438783.1 phosphonate transport system substrate-binding protein [Paenibacillus sp. PvP052]
MFKKIVTSGLSLVMTAVMAAGCSMQQGNALEAGGSKQETPAASYVPMELTVQFASSQNAETLEAKAKPLEKLLGDQLSIPVKVSVSTSYNTVIEAISSKKVDIGFLPPNAYVLAHDQKKAVDLLLQAQRYGIDDATGAETKELVDFYKAMFIVKANSPIKELKDLKGKKIAWQSVTSSAGYVWPANELKKAAVDPEKDVTGIEVKGHDKAVLAVLNGQVDAAAIIQDARNTVKKDKPDVFTQTRVVAFTAPIPSDTIVVRNDMDQAWRDQIAQAFIDIGKDPEGSKIIYEVFSHRGYVKSNDQKFNVVREYSKDIGQK